MEFMSLKAEIKKNMKLLITIFVFVLILFFGATFSEVNADSQTEELDGITATLSDDGTLTISGEGALKQELIQKFNKENIKMVDINNGVTSIGYSAFYGCSSLTSIEIPKGVTSIGYSAFRECSSLTSIEIPEGVTSIGSYAFDGCSSLTNIETPEGLTSIGNNAFDGCSSLTSIEIPEGVTSIGNNAFYRCSSLTSINVDENNKKYKSINGVLFTKDNKEIKCYPVGKLEKEYQIPEGVTSIGSYAFDGCSSLTNIEIPEGVTSIGSYAFYGCRSLISIEIPNSVTSIRDSAFSQCRSLTSIEIPEGVTSIGSYAFDGCSSLTSIEIPNGVTSIGKNAFRECSSLTDIEIPNSITSIGENAFSGCKLFMYSTQENSNEIDTPGILMRAIDSSDILFANQEIIIERCQFDENNNKIILDEDGIKSGAIIEIKSGALKGLKCYIYVNKFDISQDGNNSIIAKVIDKNTIYISGTGNMRSSIDFNNIIPKNNIKKVIIEEGVTNIGYEAFKNCSSLTSIEISSSVTSIGNYAFDGCSNLTSIEIPEGVTSIVNLAFYRCSSLTSINADENNKKYKSINGVLFTRDNKEIKCYPVGKLEKEYQIPEGVTSIGSYAFYGCSNLTSIEIPEGVTSIGSYAFYGCSNLTSIEIPSSVTSIESHAFYGCSNLTSIEIPSSVISIGSSAFSGCSNLTSIEIPEGVTSIGNNAFDGCSSLTSIEIPSSVTSLESYAFKGCSSLTNIEIPSSVISIGRFAFYRCSSLTSINVDENNKKYKSINGVLFTKDNKEIKCYPAGKLEKEYQIPEGVTSIGNDAFSGCSNLTSIEIPEGVTSIGSYAFSGCSNLTSIEIPSSVTSIRDAVFSGCSSLTNIEIPEGVTSIGDVAFQECSNLTSIEIPSSVISIGRSAFSWCSSLTNIEIPEGVTSIGKTAFYECSNLTSIVIPRSVTSIGGSVFSGCKNLTIYCKSNSFVEQYAKDNEINYIIDDIIPTLTVTGNPTTWTKENVILTVKANDNETGLKNVTVNGQEIKITNGEGTYTVNQNGTYTIVATDKVGNTKTQTVEVNKIRRISSISVEKMPNKTEYYNGETLNTEGLKIKVQYDNNTTETITSGFVCSPTSLTSEGTQKIEVTYEDNKTQFNVNVTKIIEIGNYSLENNIISNIQPQTTLERLKENISINKKIESKILNKSGVEMKENDKITTGSKLQIQLNGETVEYTIVVTGDTNGDGEVDINDIFTVNKHRLNKTSLKNEYFKAGDVDVNGNIDIQDIFKMNKYRLGKINTL